MGFLRLLQPIILIFTLLPDAGYSAATKAVDECALMFQQSALLALRLRILKGQETGTFSDNYMRALNLEIDEIEEKLVALGESAPVDDFVAPTRMPEKFRGDYVRVAHPHLKLGTNHLFRSTVSISGDASVGAFLALPPETSAPSLTQTFLVWNTISGSDFLAIGTPHRDDGFRSVTVSPSNKWVAAGMQSGLISLYAPTSSRRIRVIGTPGSPVTHLGYTVDGEGIVSASAATGIIRFIDVKTGTEQSRFQWYGNLTKTAREEYPQIHCITVSPDASLVAATSRSGQVKVWETDSGKLIYEGSIAGAPSKNPSSLKIEKIRFSPDGSYLVGVGVDCGHAPIHRNTELWAVDLVNKSVAAHYTIKGMPHPTDFNFSPQGLRVRIVGFLGEARGRLVELEMATGRKKRDFVFLGKGVGISSTSRFIAIEGKGVHPTMALLFLPPFET